MTTPARRWEEELEAAPAASQWAIVWRRFRRHRMAMVGLATLALFGITTTLAPWVAPYRFDTIDLQNVFAGPSPQHWLGTDELGRDTLTRLLYAGRVSLFVSLLATFLSVIVGTVLGTVAAWARGFVETVAMRFTDIMLALPTLPLLLVFSKMLHDWLALQQLFGPSLSIVIIVGVLTIFGWMNVTRLVYGAALSLREREFIEAARAMGASGGRIVLFHLIPNSLAPIIVAATLGLGTRVILEASLSFLGLGITPPTPSWGNMLTSAQAYMWRNPWLAFYPGLCIFIVVLAFNFVGDALRDAFDPRMKVSA